MAVDPTPAPGVHPRAVGWLDRAAAFSWGLQFAFLVPVVALLLVELYGASPGQVGTVLMLFNAVGFLASFVVPAWADRHRDYLRPMAACAVLTVLTAVGLWFSHQLVPAVLVLVLLGSPAGVGNAMLFAVVRERGADRSQVVGVRAWFSVSWIIGPPLATVISGRYGPRHILLAVGLVGLVNLGLTLLMHRRQQAVRAAVARDRQPGPDGLRVSRAAVAMMAAAFALLQATNTAVVSVMTLFVTERAGLAVSWAGLALGVAAGLEVPMLFLLGRIGARFSSVALLLSGCMAGAVYYAAAAYVEHGWVLVALQLLNAWFYSVLAGIGLTWFQEVLPRPALAAGLFSNCNRVGAIIAGPLVAVAGLTSLGYGGVLLGNAALCVLAMGVLLVASRLLRRGGTRGRSRGGAWTPGHPPGPRP